MSILNNTQQSTSIVYASEGEDLIQYDLDNINATLTKVSSITLPAFVQSGWFHPTKPLCYIASSKGGYAATVPVEEHYMAVFGIDDKGILSQVGETVPLPFRPVHICLDHAGEHVLVAYSHPPGLTIHTIKENGGIEQRYTSPELTLCNYPHQVMVSPKDDFITICATGQEEIFDATNFRGGIHVFAYKQGEISGTLNSVSLNKGLRFSPRHLEFHPFLPLAYVSLERQNELHVYRYGPDGFDAEPIFRQTTLFGGASKAFQFCGTVRIHPNGRFVYVTNRTLGWYDHNGQKMLAKGGDDIAVFELDTATGQPDPIQRINSEGIMPRTMSFDVKAEMLVVANQFEVDALDGNEMKHISQSLVLYRIDEEGRLELARKYELEPNQKPMIWMDTLCRP